MSDLSCARFRKSEGVIEAGRKAARGLETDPHSRECALLVESVYAVLGRRLTPGASPRPAVAPSRARSQASVVRAASRSERPRMTAAPTAA